MEWTGGKRGNRSTRTQRWLGRTNETVLVADTDLEMQTLLHLFIVSSANGCRKREGGDGRKEVVGRLATTRFYPEGVAEYGGLNLQSDTIAVATQPHRLRRRTCIAIMKFSEPHRYLRNLLKILMLLPDTL